MNEIEEVKSRLDLVDLIGQYVTLKKAGANYKGQCPFHQEKTASFMVSPEKQIWKCFGCGRGGDAYKFIMEAENLDFGDALKMLAKRAGVTLHARTQAEHQTRDKKETLYEINNLSSKVFAKILADQPTAKAARDYLCSRKVTDETVQKFRIGFAPKNFDLKKFLIGKGFFEGDINKAGSPQKFFERIMFPIFDVLGNVIAFTGRTLGDNQPKYLNSPETLLYNKGRVWYGLNFAKVAIKEKNYAVLVEGQMDVVALHQGGVTQAVASSGTAITETQLQILSKYTQNFLLAFDNDAAGIQTTKKVIEVLLRLDLSSKVVDFSQYKDAGELFEKDPTAWPKAVKSAQEGIDWWINQEISTAGGVQFVENKKQVTRVMLPILAQVGDPTRLDHYISRLSAALETKTEALYLAMQKIKAAPAKPTNDQPTPVKAMQLTNEEQLLAILFAKPEILPNRKGKFDEVVWQSDSGARIAEAVKKEYNKETLTKQPSVFPNQVKKSLDSLLAGKIDSWQFWLENTWPTFSAELAGELADEKLAQLSSRGYEQQKERLAGRIKQAQESGDFAQVKSLMVELNELTKERSS